MATVGLFHTGTPIQQPSIARPPSTSIPQAGEPASEPYLGFSLNLFGPFGLQWMKERQSLDDVFRDQEAIHNAELVLGHPMQKLDHTYDPHFPTNVGRFGLITVSAAQRIKKEPKNKQSRGLCSRSTRIGSCSSCKSCVPTFVYTHPFLICENDTSGPALLCRFRNDADNEVKIMKCLTCELHRTVGCSFNNGEVRLRLDSNGSVKIVYQLIDSQPIVIREVSETNIGIKDQVSAGRSVDGSNESLAESEQEEEKEEGEGEEEDEEAQEEEEVTGGWVSKYKDVGFTSDPEDEDFSDKRKRKRKRKMKTKRKRKRASKGLGSSRRTKTKVMESYKPTFSPLPTPAYTSTSSPTSSGFFEMSSQGPAYKGPQAAQGRTTIDQPDGSMISQPVHVMQAVKPKNEAAPDQPMDLDKILEEMQRKNETLKRLHQLKAENEALQLALV